MRSSEQWTRSHAPDSFPCATASLQTKPHESDRRRPPPRPLGLRLPWLPLMGSQVWNEILEKQTAPTKYVSAGLGTGRRPLDGGVFGSAADAQAAMAALNTFSRGWGERSGTVTKAE